MRDERSQLELTRDDEAQGSLGGGAMVFAVAHQHEAGTEEMARLEAHVFAEHAEKRHAAARAIHEKLDRRGQAGEINRVVESGGIARGRPGDGIGREGAMRAEAGREDATIGDNIEANDFRGTVSAGELHGDQTGGAEAGKTEASTGYAAERGELLKGNFDAHREFERGERGGG